MGGAPGSSHRCQQCRQRRKKCDLTEPECVNCQRRGLKCSGPRTSAIFVHRTATNHTRRHRAVLLEGIYQSNHASANEKGLPSVELDALNLQNHLDNFDAPVTSVIGDVLASQSHRVFYLSIIDEFKPRCGGGIFSGDRIPTGQPIFSNFALCTRVLIGKTNEAIHVLDLTLLALLTSYYGRLHSKEPLVDLAKSCYVRALGDFRQHLESIDYSNLAEDEEFRARHLTFLATVSLHMFEDIDRLQYFSAGCLAHLDGALTLMDIIGPERFQLPDLRSALCGIRGMAVYVAIERRQTTPLADRRWIDLPFSGYEKSSRDRLIDIALAVPGILQDLDACLAHRVVYASDLDIGLEPEQNSEHVVYDCISTIRELETWFDELKHDMVSPLYWDVRSDRNKTWKPEDAQIFVDPECIPEFKDDFFHLRFPDGQMAGLLMAYWAFTLELLMGMHEICEEFGTEEAHNLDFAAEFRGDTLLGLMKDTARLILQATAYMTSCFEGIIAARGPLSVVKRYFERFDILPPVTIKSI